MKNKVVLVTGASRGIGRGILLALGKAGAFMVGADIDARGAEQIEQTLKDANISGRAMVLDVTSKAQIKNLIAEVNSAFSGVDILINNAGITADNLLMRMTEIQWQKVIDTNLNSVYFLSQAVLRTMMKKKWGRIISISSVVAAIGNAGQTNYAASKAGIIGFSKSLAREVASRGITVNTIAPGFIKTAMTDKLPEAQKKALMAQIPMSRFGSIEEVAQAVLFLASENSAYITAQTLHLNGGMYSV